MNAAFGGRAFTLIHATDRVPPEREMERVQRKVADLAPGVEPELHIAQPLPTAAFSRRDLLLEGYPRARAVIAAHGFEPIVRPVGGHLAAYGEGSLVLHISAPHPEARAYIRPRFEVFGGALLAGLRALGVDARLGPVPGEYCDGEFSINQSGRTKLAGTGQRITRAGYLISAVVMVSEAGPARRALTDAYSALGIDFRPETVGCLADTVPGITLADVRHQLTTSLSAVMPLRSGVGQSGAC